MIDLLLINPGNSKAVYQDLSKDFAAIEPPTWALLLAESCRKKGFNVKILDVNAERINNQEALSKIKNINPRISVFVVYGQNPNSGTVNMGGAVNLAREIKKFDKKMPISVIGSHVQSLPKETLENEDCFDFVFTNEGVYSLWNVLSLKKIELGFLKNIKGICLRDESNKIFFTPPEKIVPQDRMDIDLPGYAWDLLPYKKKPLDLYRAHFWHAGYDFENRSPFAAIYTSLGCRFKCNFCMINIINRNDNDEIGVAGNYASMRFWSPELIIKEFDKLVKFGVKNLRISDEMFLLNKKYYLKLCNLLIERGYGKILNMWAYSRVDTVNKDTLKIVKKAGINTLCLGIESGEQSVRLEVTKGKFKDMNIREVVQLIHDNGIEIMGNYLFGLTGDTFKSMQKTLDLSIELNTIGWNAYAVMPLPGSEIYKEARLKKAKLPKSYIDYSFHSKSTSPLGTDSLSPSEILKFRDDAFNKYHLNKKYLSKIEKKYGVTAVNNIKQMTAIKLERDILK